MKSEDLISFLFAFSNCFNIHINEYQIEITQLKDRSQDNQVASYLNILNKDVALISFQHSMLIFKCLLRRYKFI